ncbi:MAG: hypothetical protein COS14_13080 [Bacteroidetes bacterium CG02_land_8_20_14_3_00_31_25]|nr:hypothetical protein [Bacteroidota bacterium]PIV57768.1 MAG: hypothetical protein COS14_13080 [Bacteroidetes bacterium CG02_land_8_20_14_3_00_31_25]PIX33978.1 MAG: hypothetical protein COZ59_08720 [Bacteroidetes bacterium CG_4_8_14_3_um_filter_31_14]PIY07367.1 MAG: hypothetical protein COZ21_00635 [Bacteroidetes bacterium CG_4_10_14_3_um_filter_31_20]
MIKDLIFILIIVSLLSCNNNTVQSVDAKFPDGKPAKVSWIKQENGKNDTIKRLEYYSNGKKKIEGEVKNGKRSGKWTYWFENGNIWSEGSFINGLSDGQFNIFNEDGSKYMQSNYKNGVPDGCWTFFNNNIKKKEVYFKDGKSIKEVNF